MTLSNEEIIALLHSYEKQSRALREDALKMSWFMRGGVSYDDVMQLSFQEREIISKIISDNMEITKKSNLPFF